MKFPAHWRVWAAAYLVLQSLLVAAWWVLLAVSPSARDYFKPATAPDVMLVAFALPDAIFFFGAAWWAAWRLIREPKRAMLPLALHVGGAIYAWLYCLLLWMLSGAGLAGAVCMLFCAILPSLFLWKLCQTDGIEL
jgi:hypothetical protein